jgi:hypothetical protein
MDPPTYPFEETSFMNGPLDKRIYKMEMKFGAAEKKNSQLP